MHEQILNLIADLYRQITTLQQQLAELRAQLEAEKEKEPSH